MKLILMRHGLAVDRELFAAKKKDDSLRPLTARGRSRSRMVAKWLARREGAVNLIVQSPMTRARQTVAVIKPLLQARKIAESIELIPSAPPMAFAQWLKLNCLNETLIMVVGHEPQLSVFASWCLSGSTQSFLDLKKSGVICLSVESFQEVTPGCAELKWFLGPKEIEALV
jgi:phosphohistidine phosphatase